MITLKRIKRENNIIEADYYPEDSKECGYFKLNTDNGNILEFKSAEGYGKVTASHAKRELLRIAKLESLPEEKTIMWY